MPVVFILMLECILALGVSNCVSECVSSRARSSDYLSRPEIQFHGTKEEKVGDGDGMSSGERIGNSKTPT